jgi:membrane-bound metal-dependent hydrolase YbcI (DUF457 family)
VILLVFIILRWSFNYESNVFRYNKILIDCVFGNSKFVVPSTLTIDLGFAINLNIVSWTCLCYFPSHSEWFFWESRLQHKFTWWLQVLWTFWIFLKYLKPAALTKPNRENKNVKCNIVKHVLSGEVTT